MPDIRTTAELDDFQRADENPLSNSGKWSQVSPSVTAMQLITVLGTKIAAAQSSNFSYSYWNVEGFNGDIESWGIRSTEDFPIGDGIRLLLVRDGGTSGWDGYQFVIHNQTGADTWLLWRHDNGSNGITIDSATISGGAASTGPYYMLRRNGNDVEGWDSSDGITWTMRVNATDTTWTTDLYPGIGGQASGGPDVGWVSFGGGIAFVPQIIRRIR